MKKEEYQTQQQTAYHLYRIKKRIKLLQWGYVFLGIVVFVSCIVARILNSNVFKSEENWYIGLVITLGLAAVLTISVNFVIPRYSEDIWDELGTSLQKRILDGK